MATASVVILLAWGWKRPLPLGSWLGPSCDARRRQAVRESRRGSERAGGLSDGASGCRADDGFDQGSVGDLDRVKRVIRLLGMVKSALSRYHQTILIAFDIEHNAVVRNEARIAVRGFDVGGTFPINSAASHQSKLTPSSRRSSADTRTTKPRAGVVVKLPKI